MERTDKLPYKRSTYRPDLDGLRALAVLLVIAFHAGAESFGGGYVGVDVFFVLTGFLITGLLVAEYRRNGRISVIDFYARRARRLLPLAGLVIFTTLIAGVLLLSPLATVDHLYDARASVLYFVNWRFAIQATAYSDVDVTSSLFLHFWSLAVEEQFYIVWPLIVVAVGWLVHRFWPDRFVPLLGLVLAVMCAISLAASILLTEQLGPEAYYVTYTRIWEIGLGAGLALALPSIRKVPRFVVEAAGALGFTAIIVAALRFDEGTTFPGGAALLPTLGAGLIILAGTVGRSAVGRALSIRPFPYIGRLSYALYLWHWPAIGVALLLNERAENGWPTGLVTVLALFAAFVLSAASHAWVENPLRYSVWIKARNRRNIALGATAMAVPLLFVSFQLNYGNLGERIEIATSEAEASIPGINLILTPSEAAKDTAGNVSGAEECHVGQVETEPVLPCVFGDPRGAQTVLLMGDSHARHWLPALDLAGRERGWRVLSLTKSACTPIDVPIWNSNYEREYRECAVWRAAVFGVISGGADIDLAIVSKSHGYGTVLSGDGEWISIDDAPQIWRSGAERTFRRLLEASSAVLVLRDTPWSTEDVPTCFSDAETTSDCNVDLDQQGGLDGLHHQLEREAAPNGVAFADPTRFICAKTNCSMITRDGLIKYSDSHHLTYSFSKRLYRQIGALVAPYMVSGDE